jgi:REP element-mobilizing transposase RayT
VTDPAPSRSNVRRLYSRGYLPHVDFAGVAQILTFRQDDSVPTRLARAYGTTIAQAKTTAARARAEERILTHLEQYLGKGRGSCRLADPRAARIVEGALLFADGRDYELIAWVVMPNHVHVVVKPFVPMVLRVITRRWKSFTAVHINRLFRTSGRFWQPEVFDRYLRDLEHQHHAIRYVELNPVTAGLCRSPLDWAFSSAKRWPDRWGGAAAMEG